MDTLDERPLERPPQPVALPKPAARTTPVVVIALAGLILGGVGAWWWIRANRGPEPATPVAARSTEAVLPQAPPARPLPILDQMDTFLRALLGTLSAHPDFVRWLATDNLIRQMANVIDRLARGLSPAPEVSVLRPLGDFDVTRAERPTIAPSSFRRYDGLATIVESLDAKAVVEAYRTVHPRLDEAYRALGRTENGVDQAVDVALQTLIDTPVPVEPVMVISGKGATYAFADAQYEQLLPAQKQLLRMGPDNVRRIQSRLREIQTLLQR